MKTTLLLVTAVVLAGCIPPPRTDNYCAYDRDCTNVIDRDPVNVVRQKLAISRHTETRLDNQCVDCILADATEILQAENGSGDMACSVRLVREGDVTEFNTGSGSIDSKADFDAVMRLPGDVKLVDEINWCGKYVVAYGCARRGESLAVVPIAPDMAGILWAHEYGHVRGRPHRDADSALMHKWVNIRNKKVDRAECDAFRKKPDSRR